MESWRKVWREGIAPFLSTEGLEALEKALETDDPRLLQRVTTQPPPLRSVIDWPVEAGDAIVVCSWLGDGLTTVGECEEHFARICYECDQRLGEPAGVRWFLNWYDSEPRDTMRKELLIEVEITLLHRTSPSGVDKCEMDTILFMKDMKEEEFFA